MWHRCPREGWRLTVSGDAMSARESANALWLVIGMGTAMSALRLAIALSNELTLWYLYGWATLKRDHLRIIKIKPELVVSNGDVLRGIGFYHYLVGVAIWLPLTVGLLTLIHSRLLPEECQAALRTRGNEKVEKHSLLSGLALIWVLALFFLVTGILPMGWAMVVGFGSVLAAVIWAQRIYQHRSELG